MELITSINNKKIKSLKKNSDDTFISFNLDVIKRADKLGLLKEVYSINDLNLSINTTLLSKEVINKISSTNVIARISKIHSKVIKDNRIIYLDEINDPTNLAKIILLMHQYNYKELILSNNSVSLYNQKCLEIIKDKLFDINVSYGDILTLKDFKNNGYQILSTGLKSSTLLNEVKHKDKYVLIMGNESRGVSNDILSMSDIVIKIPITNIDSLNVAVATAIIFDNI